MYRPSAECHFGFVYVSMPSIVSLSARFVWQIMHLSSSNMMITFI